MTDNLPLKPDYAANNAVASTARYVCAWGVPESDGWPLPKMLRYTIAIDDPTGRLPDGQTYEYVMELPN
jgi:hypothetical protein